MEPYRLLALVPFVVTSLFAQDAASVRSWDKVQYLGGAAGVMEISENWHNSLTISPTLIRLKLGNARVIEIATDSITSVTYSGKRMIREFLASNVSRVFIFTAMATSHFIGVEFSLPDGRKTGILLRAHKDNFQEIVAALRSLPKLIDMPAAEAVK